MAAKTYSGKKPENMKKTVGYFLSYMGRHKRMLFVVAVHVSVSSIVQSAWYLYDPSGSQWSGRWKCQHSLKGVHDCCWDFCYRCSLAGMGIFPDHGESLPADSV